MINRKTQKLLKGQQRHVVEAHAALAVWKRATAVDLSAGPDWMTKGITANHFDDTIIATIKNGCMISMT